MKVSERASAISPFFVMDLLGRARQLEAEGREIIHMEVGEPEFPTPEPIVKAGIEFLMGGAVHYTPAAGLPELREVIVSFYERHYGVKLSASRVFITPGSSGALLMVLAALLDAGDEVLLPDPGYPCNSNFIRLLEGKSRLIPVGAENNFQLDANLVEMAWDAKTRGVLISSPSNPTGTMLERGDFSRLLDAIESRNGFLISDEIYHGLTYENRAVSALELSDNSFVINSFSKYFGMTGWRLGWAIVPEQFVETMERLCQNVFISAPTHSQQAALAAFSPETLSILEQRKAVLKERRDYLFDELKGMGFEIPVKPSGAFYIYAECRHTGLNSHQFCEQLLEQYGVAVTPGYDFGRNRADDFIRFAYTSDLHNIKKGCERIAEFLTR